MRRAITNVARLNYPNSTTERASERAAAAAAAAVVVHCRRSGEEEEEEHGGRAGAGMLGQREGGRERERED